MSQVHAPAPGRVVAARGADRAEKGVGHDVFGGVRLGDLEPDVVVDRLTVLLVPDATLLPGGAVQRRPADSDSSLGG